MHVPKQVKQHSLFRVRFVNLGCEAMADAGESLLSCLNRAGGDRVFSCAGRGVCSGCVVRVLSGKVSLLTGADGSGAETADAEVRACQVRPQTDLEVEVQPRALVRAARGEVAERGLSVPAELAPAVRVREVAAVFPEAGSGDLERLLRAAGEKEGEVDLEALRRVPGELRDGGAVPRAVFRGKELIGIIPSTGRCLGLAVDLGTTNLAGSLTDLETGAVVAQGGLPNPQGSCGGDLISRIDYALRFPAGGSELQSAALDGITELARELCAKAGALPDEIADVAVCGNTAMHHLLLRLPVAQLGRVPFVPAVCSALDVKAREVGLSFLPGAYLHLFPNVGGFVGGDHVATLLATEEQWKAGTTLVIDIGTNAEMSLIRDGSILTASAASGPALEGGNISCGMRAAPGAVERVWVEGGAIRVGTVGGRKPVGICGSGVVDAVAALREAGILDRRGYLRPNGAEATGYPLAPQVSFTQQDVRAVQLAKGAVRAGIDLLLREAGVFEGSLDRVVVAGGFGAYLHIGSAVAIGLFPSLPGERFLQVGNAAAAGVRMALASVRVRRRAIELASRCRHVELGGLAEFQRCFMKRMAF